MHGSTGGNWKRSKPDQGHEEERPAGNRLVIRGFATYRQATPPRQFPTLRALGDPGHRGGPRLFFVVICYRDGRRNQDGTAQCH
jgi:hypothetical protein